MVRAAQRAAAGLMRDFARLKTLPVSEKGPSDFVSSADLDAQAAVRAELSDAYPQYGWLGEEDVERDATSSEARFIVDPLDGTTNFLHGIPHFAVSIALEVKGEIAAGVVLNPATGELFWAEKGGGAWLGESRLEVSLQRDLAQSVVGVGIPHLGRPGHVPFVEGLTMLMPKVAGVRRLGAAALDLTYVAAGRYDVFWEFGLSPWDVAAGQLLVREAGGMVTKSSGQPMRLDDGDILASSGEPLHGAAVALLGSLAHGERSRDDDDKVGKTGAIELRRGLAGVRHYLCGRLLNGGDTVQLCFSGGWVTGRYEWNRRGSEMPNFHCSIELAGGQLAEHALPIPEGALLRWP